MEEGSPDERFRLTPETASRLASDFGTPLYVLNESHLRSRIRRYKTAFQSAYPAVELSYASKANSTLAVLQIAHKEGLLIDVASEGEFRGALLAGIPAHRCVFHGSNKSRDELLFAFEQGIGQVVIDNFHEISLTRELLGQTAPVKAPNSDGEAAPLSDACKFLLRLAPGVDPITHHRISTGQEDSKFGFNIADGSAETALAQCLELGLRVKGFHCHVGSQLLDPEAQQAGGEALGAFAREMLRKHGFRANIINVGGGLGVRYLDEDRPMPVEEYCRSVVEAVIKGLGDSGLKPVIGQEPGRALIAESGVTLYTVGSVKTVPTEKRSRTYVAVDGGLADNPRPAMYDAEYTVERVCKNFLPHPSFAPAQSSGREDELQEFGPSIGSQERKEWEEGLRIASFTPDILASGGLMAAVSSSEIPLPSAEYHISKAEDRKVTVCGRHCETDDLFMDVDLPDDVGPGDLLQVLCTGAYNASMASNYNRYPRPATVLITNEGPKLVQRRESWDELFAREIPLERG